MPHAYAEDQLVEQPAIGLFAQLGWQTVSALEETFGPPSPGLAATLSHPTGEGASLGRETKGEVVLVFRLRAALEKLNPALPSEAITAAVDELTRDRSAMSLAAANREVYQLLKEGIPVSVVNTDSTPHPGPLPGRGGEGGGALGTARPTKGGQTTVRVRVIDWEQPANNDFLLVSQFSVTGALYTCRPDLVCFVNGLPLLVVELKKPGVPARAAFNENLTSYKHSQNGIPALFVFNAMLIASNGTDSRVGSLTADWERFFEWKRIEREDEPRRVSLEVMLRGTCDKTRLLDLVENFTLFSEHKAGLVKIIGQNHQFLGVNNAIVSMLAARKSGHGRGGVFWQTQGSGKAYSMVFFAQKVLRKVAGNWTFVVVTDRVELDDQIAKTFKATGAAIIGADLPKDAAEDSFNLLPALLGKDSGPIRPYLLEQAFSGSRTLSIRRGQWKYLDHAGSGGNRYDNNPELKPFILPDTAPDAPGQLYNLEAAPGETRNLYFEQPQVVKELKTLLDQSKASGRSRPERPASNP